MAKMLIKNFQLTFDSRKARKQLHNKFQNLLKDAVTGWVKEAESIIPVYSGESRATLIELGLLVQYNVGAGINPKVPSRVAQGQASGAASTYKDKPPGRYSFRYESDVFQLNLNERFPSSLPLTTPTPYHFIEKSDKVANAIVEDGIENLGLDIIIRENTSTRRVST